MSFQNILFVTNHAGRQKMRYITLSMCALFLLSYSIIYHAYPTNTRTHIIRTVFPFWFYYLNLLIWAVLDPFWAIINQIRHDYQLLHIMSWSVDAAPDISVMVKIVCSTQYISLPIALKHYDVINQYGCLWRGIKPH